MLLKNISPTVQTLTVLGQPRTVAPEGLVTVPDARARELLASSPRVWAEEPVFALPGAPTPVPR